ncbi:hypothetical protein QKC54_gp0921 [Megavirus baoshan]|uniref:Uncharacterized protein n=1 Tax=Megavirus baoshan TaxID=2496520 RepID=A0A8K1W678_9VIRU|nr:hypothetical protein QKC54_gp0921 [Megavirus baoshan]UFX99744.1 hypothetical protein Mb0151 [Megavirus baoshan]
MHKIKRTTPFISQSYLNSSHVITQLLNKSKIYISRYICDYKQDQKLYTRHYYANTKISKKENMDRYLNKTEEIIFSFMDGFTDGCICGNVIILCLINI